MDAKVIKAFRDREHMETTYYEGDKFSGTAERVKDLAERGFVEVAKAPRKRTTKKAETTEE